jgi:hypothetical protein
MSSFPRRLQVGLVDFLKWNHFPQFRDSSPRIALHRPRLGFFRKGKNPLIASDALLDL